MIKMCSCAHEYQDQKYGLQHRVHNEFKGKDGFIYYKCTVCGREITTFKKQGNKTS